VQANGSQPPVTAVVVDGSEILAHALKALAAADGVADVVAVATTGADGIRYARGHHPEVVLVGPDVPSDVMRGLDGQSAEGLSQFSGMLRKASPESGIMFIFDGDSVEPLYDVFLDGAAGVVERDGALDEFQACLKATSMREPHVSSRLALDLLGGSRTDDPLSDREREVLTKVAYGMTNAEIASELHLSVRTVESHRAHLYDKLGLQTRAQLVRYALDHKLLK
jgi:two-component system response regulator NreC